MIWLILLIVICISGNFLLPDTRTKEEKIYDDLKYRDYWANKWIELLDEKKKE